MRAAHFRKNSEQMIEAVIFNRKGVEQLGFNKPEEAIGKKIDFWGEQYLIVGITENFHEQSLREAYEPLIFRLVPDVHGFLPLNQLPHMQAQPLAR